MAKKLIAKGITIDQKDKYGNTPLWRAAFESKGKQYEMVSLLMEHKANIHSLNHAQKSPLMFANQVGDNKLIKLMMKHQQHFIDSPNKEG